MDDKVANSIRDSRRKAGITQEELARALGVSRQTIISIERGRYVPSLMLALKISRFFRCATDEMFRIDDTA